MYCKLSRNASPLLFEIGIIILHKTDLCETFFTWFPVLLPVQERQLQSHAGMLESFKADLSYLRQNLPEGRKAKAKELEEHRVRAEYLQHEVECCE